MRAVDSTMDMARPVDTFRITPVPPFRLDLTAWTLRRGPANKLDRWDGKTYSRTFAWRDKSFEVSVTQNNGLDKPSLEVIILAAEAHPEFRPAATQALDSLLGLKINLDEFYRLASARKELTNLVERFRGVKPPRFPSLFEALVNGIVFQQVSLSSGIVLLNHLAETYGRAAAGITGQAFLQPESIAGLAPEDLRPLGISRQKGRYLTELASKITQGLKLEQVESMNDEEAIGFLYQLNGIGRWTAQYVLLRGLGRIRVFPGDDIGARNRIKSWLGLDKVPDYERMQDITAAWHPYGGMVYFHLLLNHLAEKGYIT